VLTVAPLLLLALAMGVDRLAGRLRTGAGGGRGGSGGLRGAP
jgi:hypothetical protein